MKTGIVKAGDAITYKNALKHSNNKLFFIGFMLFLIGYLATQSLWSIVFPFAVVCFEYFESKKWYSTYILEIEFTEDNVIMHALINYSVEKVIIKRQLASAEIKRVWYKLNSNPRYLYMQLDGKIVKQFMIGDWEQEKFREVLSMINDKKHD